MKQFVTEAMAYVRLQRTLKMLDGSDITPRTDYQPSLRGLVQANGTFHKFVMENQQIPVSRRRWITQFVKIKQAECLAQIVLISKEQQSQISLFLEDF